MQHSTAADICATYAKIKRRERGENEKCLEETRATENVHLEDPRRAQANNRRGVLRQELRGLEAVLIINAHRMRVCLFTDSCLPLPLLAVWHLQRTHTVHTTDVYMFIYMCTRVSL